MGMIDGADARRAVFLDRDGVIVSDEGLLADRDHVRLLDGVVEALGRLAAAGFALIVVTNQPAIARGDALESDVAAVNETIRRRIEDAGGPVIARFYICPHHPRANLAAYRSDCDCRKPKAGLVRRAAADLGIDVARSFMVGDRITDIIAGATAGCRTIQVLSGSHLEPTIETSVPIDGSVKPDLVCADLAAAAEWIVAQ